MDVDVVMLIKTCLSSTMRQVRGTQMIPLLKVMSWIALVILLRTHWSRPANTEIKIKRSTPLPSLKFFRW